MNRRALVVGMIGTTTPRLGSAGEVGSAAARIAVIEARLGGRLGLAAVNLENGRRFKHRADERFPLCSTFKLLLAGAVLARVDEGQERLDRRVPFGAGDLLDYAPVTQVRVTEGAMSIADLCAAAITLSDNTAANLLLTAVGGPPALTTFARHLGDGVTRLDRTEPALNSAIAGDPRDTTTPWAMIGSLRRLTLGGALTPESKARLTGWLIDCKTGAARLRAGMPAGARVGDKTGSGVNGTGNDVAIVWPAVGGPWLIAVYITGARRDGDAINAAIAEVGSIAAGGLAA